VHEDVQGQSRQKRGHVGRSDRTLLCPQSDAVEGDGDLLAEFWEWVIRKQFGLIAEHPGLRVCDGFVTIERQ
jgi:hypothetical protein